MRNKKWIITILIVIIATSALVLCRDSIIKLSIENREKRLAFPDEGVYYCAELDVEISLAPYEMLATFASGESVRLYKFHNKSGSFASNDSRLMVYYRWNQKENTITLRFAKNQYNFNTDIQYVFECIS